MELEYKGANCVVISSKKTTVVIDPKLSLVGLKDVKLKPGAMQLATQRDFAIDHEEGLTFDGPGEYEAAGVSIKGVAATRHIDTPDEPKAATMYKFDMGDLSFAVLGHINSQLSDEQLEALGVVDILLAPVGGNGYTLDAHEAVKLVRQIDPKVVVPTHYEDKALQYEVPQAELDLFLKELGAAHEQIPKLKLKSSTELPVVLTVFEVTRTT